MSKFESIPQKLLTPLGDINILDSLIPCRFRIDLHSSEAKTLVALWHDLIIVFFSKYSQFNKNGFRIPMV